jgi:phospholipid/cholesterol/gamma-HCH transport system permease protein
MSEAHCGLTVSEDPGSGITISLSGRVSLETFTRVKDEVEECYSKGTPGKITLDLAGVEYMDRAGALLLIELENDASARSFSLAVVNMSSKEQGIMNLLDRDALFKPALMPKERGLNIIQQIGNASLDIMGDLVEAITFGGEIMVNLLLSLLKPLTVRWGDVLSYMKKVGVDGLPIVGLISFLLGLIMAFMSSLQLKQFGANIYVASLVSVAMVKELGPIMTAIIVAGRSGSAFAAEIGTMRVNEEVDALTTMGFNPVRFLVIPKVLAAVFVFPFLTLFSDIFAVGGGLVVGVLGLDLTVYTYIQETIKPLEISDILTSLVKSVVFAIFISGTGCMRGFQVRGGAEEVGNATTSAVVSSLFLIIVIDSIFAIVTHYI